MQSDALREFPSHLLDGLDLSELDAICRRSVKATRQKLKFADLDKEIARAWKTVRGLGLDRSPPLDVLDLGLGAGYFLHVCQRLGHRVVGLDRPDLPLWPQICGWLGVNTIVEHTITPHTPLPDLGRRFDLVTAFACPFNYLESEHRLWTMAEWDFFFDDLRDRALKPNGRFALRLRKGFRGLIPQPPDVALFNELCRERGWTGSVPVLVFDPLR
jgi:SAM-dependent methyltransferase